MRIPPFWCRLSKRSLAYSLLVLLASSFSPAQLHDAKAGASHFIASVRINDAVILRGQNATVSVDLTALGGADPENTVGFSLTFDPTQLAFISAALGSGAAGCSLTVNPALADTGKIGFALAKSPGTGFTAGTHQIIVITMLSLANGTAPSALMAIGDVPIARELISVNVQSLPSSWSDGTATLVDTGCNYSIAPSIRYYSAKVGSGMVTVTATPGCPWVVSNLAPDWIMITSASNGMGDGSATFSVAVNSGAVRTGRLYIAGHPFSVAQGANFLDVAQNDVFYEFIGKISAARITLGCDANGPLYCPSATVTRGQMAAFIIRALGTFNPPTPASQRFLDVPPSNPFYAFIEEMAMRGITLGCDLNGPLYCPETTVNRQQMAAFIIRALGNFNPQVPASQRFLDVPPSNVFYAFIEDMAVRSITLGCNATGPLYCPADDVSRGQMAAFLARAFLP